MIAGVRDWLAGSHRQAQLLVLVDERPYAERMGAGGLRSGSWRASGLGGVRGGARPPGVCPRSRAGADDGGGRVERLAQRLWHPPRRERHVVGPAAIVNLSLVSHTNVGKTTLARTLLRRDVGEVRDEAHVTETAEGHVLIDTPGGETCCACGTRRGSATARVCCACA